MGIIGEFERRLGLNSGNTSKPTSSDGLRKKPVPQRLPEVSGNKSGGQVGHKGQALMMTDTLDAVVAHEVPDQCTGCGVDLSGVSVVATERRQVFD